MTRYICITAVDAPTGFLIAERLLTHDDFLQEDRIGRAKVVEHDPGNHVRPYFGPPRARPFEIDNHPGNAMWPGNQTSARLLSW
ncbi:MAG: hypothetical protein M1826_000195 [Phylliscum demangeonii]|nr:MAG: hypothetical protein M1826_000195 [Phylliscum demangeonii]